MFTKSLAIFFELSFIDSVSQSKNVASSYISGVGSQILLSAKPHKGWPPTEGILELSIRLQIDSLVPPISINNFESSISLPSDRNDTILFIGIDRTVTS